MRIDLESEYFDVTEIDDVTVIRLRDRELRDPAHATAVGRDLKALLDPAWPGRFLVDLGRVQSMSSTGFAVLLGFARRAAAARGEVKVCNLRPFVRIGADIIRLGEVVPILDRVADGVASFGP